MTKAAIRHIHQVSAVVEGQAKPPADEAVWKSWLRSATELRVDPASDQLPRILTESELQKHRETVERLIELAQAELDHLYTLVRPVHYVILLCDKDGVVIDHRGEASESAQFRYWGVWLGGIWAEDVEGTNGIGTCIAERRPVTVHRSQHFRARHIDLSCSGAPILDPDGELVAVLDVSSIDPSLSEHAHALTGALTIAAAQAIEERVFRERFYREWILAVRVPDEIGGAMLLAVDRERRIAGADRNGRNVLRHLGHRLENGVSLWTVFRPNDALLRHKDGDDVWTELQPLRRDEAWLAILTPPEQTSARWSQSKRGALHLRPRLDALATSRHVSQPSRTCGGLSPAALRRIREFVDSHLDRNIDLKTLAATAELSLYHFARTFKQSEGTTPHAFLLERRLAKARELLTDSNLSLSEVALAVGFADQSHLTRRFREIAGVSPGQFRRQRR
jgi:transcriptional regulator of acetoin/glycerol metabolism